MHFSEDFMSIVEKKFSKFMQASSSGIRKDYYRKLRRKEQTEVFVEDLSGDINELLHFDKVFTQDLMQTDNSALLDGLRQLTIRQREIISYLVEYEMTEAEIAARFNITQQGVNSTKNKALKKLKSCIKGGSSQ